MKKVPQIILRLPVGNSSCYFVSFILGISDISDISDIQYTNVFFHIYNNQIVYSTIYVPEPPGPPEGPIKQVKATETSLTVSWGPSKDDGGSEILHYSLEKREAWKTSYTHVAKVKADDDLTVCVDGLRDDQEYNFKVFATNAVGDSKAIESSPFKPRSPHSKLMHSIYAACFFYTKLLRGNSLH